MIYLDKNIAVIVYNIQSDPPYSDILNTVALTTTYKIHVILTLPKSNYNDIEIYGYDNLYGMVNVLADANSTGKPIYIHIPRELKLPNIFISERVILIREIDVKKYRFGKIYLMKRKDGFYSRVSENTYMNSTINKWCKLNMNL